MSESRTLKPRDWSVNRLAANAVARIGPGTPAERKEFLNILGLLADDGGITPDDLTIYEFLPVNDAQPLPRRGPTIREPGLDRSLIPAGLRDLPPAADPPKPRRRRATGASTACGTMGGRGQHGRRGEPLCRACKDFQNDYAKRKRAEKRAAALAANPDAPPPTRKRPTQINPDLPARPETCGTMAGRSNHYRRGEKLCRPCKDAYNASERARRAQRGTQADVIPIGGRRTPPAGEVRSA